jgi:dipeptidyl aminopeptidase/acylaminoacyl peptidase
MKRSIRQRDGQQWINDYMLKVTGRPIHYERDNRQLPAQAKSMRMVTKYIVKEAEHAEHLARSAEQHGDLINARALYRTASEHYREAQHFVTPATDPKRWDILAKSMDCAKRMFDLLDYPVELVEIPFGDKSIPGILHLQPGGIKAPAVVFIPGMDNTKENYPDPFDNEFHQRGMHVLAIDGPGQGEALERGIYVTPDNHAAAATAAYEFMARRKDVDEDRIGLSGRSFGSFWAMRAAADEHRYAAVGSAVACYYWDYLTIFDEAPIRFKQVFMAMAGMEDEAEFDEMSEGFTLQGHAEHITCPVLMCIGEFDPLNPLEDAEKVFDALNCQKEMWVFEDEFHSIRTTKTLSGRSTFHFIAEWMDRALNGNLPKALERKTFIQKDGRGMYDE